MSIAGFYSVLIIAAVVISLYFGWRGASDLPQNATDFARSAAWVLAWSGAWIFLSVILLVASVNPSSMAMLFQDGLWFTAASGMIWVPTAMIAYVVHALRLRRA